MSGLTDLSAVENQIQTKWSSVFMAELRETFMLQSLCSKEYEGEIKNENDTVRITQINAPSSTLKTIGTDSDTYEANVLDTSYVDLKATKRAVSAMKFTDLVQIQSIIDPTKNPGIRNALMHDIGTQINTYLYSLMVPSTSSPDHTIGSTATLTEALIATMRENASIAKWPKASPWYCLMGPSYYSDFLAINGVVGIDYGFQDQARVGGQFSQDRYGFKIYEDNSIPTATSLISFLPEALLFAAQTEPRIKLSDLHSNGEFGFSLSIDMVFGAKLSIDGAKKCYTITSV